MSEIKLRTKPEEVSIQLSAMASSLGGGAKLPSVRELSRFYGVSQMTLLAALDKLEAQQIITRKRGSGVFVSNRLAAPSTKRNIVLLYDFRLFRSAGHSLFWDMLIEQSQERAAQKNEECQLLLFNSPFEEPNRATDILLAQIESGQVQGIIAVILDKTTLAWLGERGIPLVTFAGASQWEIELDGVALLRLGVEHLVAQGCRRIGWWRPVFMDVPGVDAEELVHEGEQAARDEIEKHGLPFDAQLMRCGMPPLLQTGEVFKESHQEQGFRVAMECFGSDDGVKPDGLIISDDLMTHGALVALEKLGVRVGEDVKIASHANRSSPILMGQDKLTLIEFDSHQLVQTMFSMLETVMDGQLPPVSPVFIQPRLRL